MNLTKYLRSQGYDLIDGPVRNHQVLQLWLKRPFNDIELYYNHIDHAFISTFPLNTETSAALEVNASLKNTYKFNLGLTTAQETLKSLGMGEVELGAKLKSGKSVAISFDGSETTKVATGEVENYLSQADFRHPNPILLRNANRDQIILITGVLYASTLVVDIETEREMDTELVKDLVALGSGKVSFSQLAENQMQMISRPGFRFPVAVKANRLDFDKGIFNGSKLVTDNRRFF
jgi:hypothetical protein